jgi:DNA segregation ATPase FtsK/SpoIIIE-like protein
MPKAPNIVPDDLRTFRLADEPGARPKVYEYRAVAAAAIALFLCLCLFSYDPRDPSLNTVTQRQDVSNLGGLLGAYLADGMVQLLGMASLLIPLGLALVAARMFRGTVPCVRSADAASWLAVALSSAGVAARCGPMSFLGFSPAPAGGAAGALIHSMSSMLLGGVGEALLLATVGLLSVLHLLRISVRQAMRVLAAAAAVAAYASTLARGVIAKLQAHRNRGMVEQVMAAGEPEKPQKRVEIEDPAADRELPPCESAPAGCEDLEYAAQARPSWERLSFLPLEDNPPTGLESSPILDAEFPPDDGENPPYAAASGGLLQGPWKRIPLLRGRTAEGEADAGACQKGRRAALVCPAAPAADEEPVYAVITDSPADWLDALPQEPVLLPPPWSAAPARVQDRSELEDPSGSAPTCEDLEEAIDEYLDEVAASLRLDEPALPRFEAPVPRMARLDDIPEDARNDGFDDVPESVTIGGCADVAYRLEDDALDDIPEEDADETLEDDFDAPLYDAPDHAAADLRDETPHYAPTGEGSHILVAKRADEEVAASQRKVAASSADSYELPPTSLLDEPPASDRAVDEKFLEDNALILEQKLSDLGVKGQVVAIHPGPVITMYEVSLAPGVPLRKILNMADDLAMALKSGSTRVVAPIPGKDTVGIEVPNLHREIVHFREIVESPAFMESEAQLKLALGKGIDGEPFAAGLSRMPHLLIAGATGTGKSVGLNCIICSWLMSCHPDDLKLILVDPKKLEMSHYEGIPHLIHPVVTETDKVPAVLSWAIREMERRYDLLSQVGAKNIDGYNRKIAAGSVAALDADDQPLEKLPYIVIIVDELAELMMVAAKDIEISIARLAQMARASGIHLILATQRPSVDVITGVIKANFPARMSFQVSARADSRTILDTVGAESLLGMGDMLFLPPGTAKMKRLHGAYISENEIGRVVEFIKAQREPVYIQEISRSISETGSRGGDDDLGRDDKYDLAVELVTRLGHASISLIQRHMRIGYNRAARIMEAMEADGLVGPSDGTSRPREVLARSLDHIPA